LDRLMYFNSLPESLPSRRPCTVPEQATNQLDELLLSASN